MAAPPDHNVTFLFTDIEGSAQTWESYPDAMRWALARHDALLRRAIEDHGGSIFKNVGDGFYAVFGDAAEAVAAALDAQRALHAEEWGTTASLSVRMAVHPGPTVSNGQDYFGAQLSRTTRLLTMAHGGQMLVSGGLFDSLRNHLPRGSRLRDLGEYQLHELRRPEHIYQLEALGLPGDFPPLRSTSIQRRPTGSAIQEELIGREQELSALLGTILRADSGLITLTGPGGIGKTRLAIHVASELDDHFEHGVYFVDLTQVGDPARFASTLAQTLGVLTQGGQPLAQTLKDFAQGRHLLLVLDNFGEIEGGVTFVLDLLTVAPRLKALVTRREPFSVRGELVFLVPPLELPPLDPLPPLRALAEIGAIALFVERAQLTTPGFALTEANARTVAELCARLDGFPLALEVAAARIRVLSPQKMLEQMTDRVTPPASEARAVPQPGTALRSAITWSYDLLEPAEKALFRRFGIFRGGASLEGIEFVCLGWGALDAELLTVLLSLVDKNLLLQTPGATGRPRFTMLEAIRDVALEEARASGELEETRRRHRLVYAQIGEMTIRDVVLLDQPDWAGLDTDEENIRAAIQSAVESNDLESERSLVGTIAIYWSQRAKFDEGLVYVDAALARSEGAPPSQALGRLLMGAGMLHWYVSDLATVGRFLDRGMVVSREAGDLWGQVFALANGGLLAQFRGDGERALLLCREAERLSQVVSNSLVRSLALGNLGRVLIMQGDYAGARAALETGLEETHRGKSVWGQVTITNSLGDVARITGDLGHAEEYYRQALAAFVKAGFVAEAASALHNLGHVRLLQGKADEALSNFTMGLIEQRRVDNRAGIAECLMGIVGGWALEGRLERAARLAGAVDALRTSIGDTMVWPAERMATEQIMANLRSAMPADLFAAALAEGHAMSQEDAIEYVAAEFDE